jgi:DNA repair protein RadC
MNKITIAEVKLSYKTQGTPYERLKIATTKEAYHAFLSVWDVDEIEHRESFKVLLLNHAGGVLGFYHASTGGIHCTAVDIKLIFQAALLSNASKVIIAHNHPSGDTKPSHADALMTNQLREAAKVMDILFLDHLILSKDHYYSFAENEPF